MATNVCSKIMITLLGLGRNCTDVILVCWSVRQKCCHISGRSEFKVTCYLGQNYCIMAGTSNLCCWTHIITGCLIGPWEWCH